MMSTEDSSKMITESQSAPLQAAEEEDDVRQRVRVKISRPVFTQESFDQGHHMDVRRSKTVKDRLQEYSSQISCSTKYWKTLLFRVFPFLPIMGQYHIKSDLLSDVIAGITVGVMHIPQGMAYGLLASLPPVYGLYVSFFPAILYFFFGTSKHVSIGTFAVVSLMVGIVVDKSACGGGTDYAEVTTAACPTSPPGGYSTEDSLTTVDGLQIETTLNITDPAAMVMSSDDLICKVGVATAVTFLVGIIQLAMGLLHLGFMTIYLSEPLTRGFTTGAAIHVFTTQIKYVFGIQVQRYTGSFKLIYTYVDFFSNLAQTNPATLTMSVICLVLLFVVKQFVNPRVKKKICMPIPIELIVVFLGTLVSYLAHFRTRFNMTVVGNIPTGIPAPSFPPAAQFPGVIGDAVGISIVAFAVNVSLAKLFAKKHGYEVQANQELVAYGLTNSISSCFNCYVNSASLSRSLVQEGAGGVTQVAGLVSSALLLVVLFAIGPLFEQLPNNVLAAIIIVNLKGMFLQLLDLPKLWHISKYDFLIWLITWLSVVILDVDIGLVIGVAFSLLTVVFRTQRPYTCILGRVPKTDIYKDIMVYRATKEVPGISIFRMEASLYYANCEYFIEKLYLKTNVNPRKIAAERCRVEKKKAAWEKKARQAEANHNARQHEEAGALDVEGAESFQLPVTGISYIIIDCTTMGYIDYAGVSTLSQILQEYKEIGVAVSLAGCKAGMRQMLEAAGFFKKTEKKALFISIHDAVMKALENNPTLLELLKADSPLTLSEHRALTPTCSHNMRLPTISDSDQAMQQNEELMNETASC